jgi:hypothetical protein
MMRKLGLGANKLTRWNDVHDEHVKKAMDKFVSGGKDI